MVRPNLPLILLLSLISSTVLGTPATDQEVADFWETVFTGPAPHGVPPLNPSRTNQRVVGAVTVWDVGFDSYRDPDTNAPVRIGGFFAVPNNVTPPGPQGTYPGLVSTHSVGGCPTCQSPAEGLDTAVYYAELGFAAMAFYLRGYSPSDVSDPALDADSSNVALCTNMVGDGQQPFDTLWAGYPVDLFQAAEWMAQQPEVWNQNGLSFIGHSLGGYAAVMAGIFSDRYRVIAASAPPTTGSDIAAWMAFGNPISACAGRLPGNTTTNIDLAIRMVSFVGVYQAINSPLLVAKNAEWRLDNTETFFYGGEADTAVPPADVAESYRLADASNDNALHWSPTGGHGGPESFYRSDAWLAGHYPGITPSPPTADLVASAVNGLTVTFSAQGSTDDAIMIAYDYDFGDGETQNWGDTVTHTYAAAGSYAVTLTVTDGEGLRDTATLPVTVGGQAAVEILSTAPPVSIVDEGTSSVFTVNLSAPPGEVVSIAVTRDSGDPDLTIAPATLGFSDANWNVPHEVTITAAEDADGTSDRARFAFTAPTLPTLFVDAVERDDDATFTLVVGTATGAAGAALDVPITLANPDRAAIRSLSVTLRFDGETLGTPAMTRGSEVPGPAWWMFGDSSPEPGEQVIEGSEIAQPEGVVIDGLIATDRFTLPADAPPGRYDVTSAGAQVDGRPVTTQIDGFVRIVAGSPDAGVVTDAGVSTDAGAKKDGGAAVPPTSERSRDGGCGCNVGPRPSGTSWLLFGLVIALMLIRWSGARGAGHVTPADD